MPPTATHIAALLTCHNRKATTLACLKALHAQELPPATHIHVYLVDDGSTDGTRAAVASAFSGVTVLRGDGSLFWNGGMRLAFEQALATGYDYYLWLNDDTRLYPNALKGLLHARQRIDDDPVILVGSTQDPRTGQHTYGGLVHDGSWHPFKYERVTPTDAVQPCTVMNGNCVLITQAAAQRVGNLDAAFTHAIGDFDYALRARRAGCSLWVAPGFVGTCSRNALQGSWLDDSLSTSARLKKMRSPKGLPPREWMRYARRHAGFLWPVYGSLPLIRTVLAGLRSRSSSPSI